jgi:hypothetical protein
MTSTTLIQTVKTETIWYSPLQFAPDEGCPVLVMMIADDGFSVSIAEIGIADGQWRCVYDNARLDPDDIELWAEIALPKFHN